MSLLSPTRIGGRPRLEKGTSSVGSTPILDTFIFDIFDNAIILGADSSSEEVST